MAATGAGAARRAGIGALGLAAYVAAAVGVVQAHSVTVDGVPTDWTLVAPTPVNLAHVGRNALAQGEYVWRDNPADERTDFAAPDPRVDLRELRVTGDATRLYILARMTDIDVVAGEGAPQLQVAVDVDRVALSGQPFFAAFADTTTSPSSEWEYLVVTRFGSGSAVAVLDAAFQNVASGTSAISAVDDVIELSVPWSALGMAGPPALPLRFTVATFRSNVNDDTWDVGGSSMSNALDAVTNYGDPGATLNTFSEVDDTVVDYAFEVSFDGAGEVFAPVLITQALYDPLGTEPDGEWIEMRNVSTAAVDLAGFHLGDEESIDSSEGMRTFPAGSPLAPGGKAVVANAAVSFLSAYGAPPHFEINSTSAGVPDLLPYPAWASGLPALANTGDELLLLDAFGTVVDVVTYGTGSWPGVTAHAAIAAGHSLKRTEAADTNDNSVDFVDNAAPDPAVDLQADLALTKTDGAAVAVPGATVAYTIAVSNAGPSPANGATVSDTVPATITGATWTCLAAGGGTCAASGSGDISDTVSLPVGGSVTYTLTGTVSASAIGSLSNTATVAAPAGVSDPNVTNNSATDTDSLAPQADLSITKTDGSATAVPGQPVTYTIVASNAGPSAATGATVTDTVPAVIAGASWTCLGAGGGTCAASGSGDISDTANLPPGASVIYTLTGTVSASATGTLSNTVTVAAPGGVADPAPGDNSATDTDTLVGLDYFTLAPCRVIDTRGLGAPIGGPALAGQQTRVFAMLGHCGIPPTAKALSVNVTVTAPGAAGNIRLFPAGLPVPTVSAINYAAGQTRANNAVILLNSSGEMAAFAGQASGTTTHLVVDVNGYFE